MNSIPLATPSKSYTTSPLTAEAYFAAYPESTQRMELIEGVVIELASPTDAHQAILGQLFMALNAAVLSQALGQLRFAPLDVTLDYDTVVQPDLFFVSKDNAHCYVGENGKWYGAPDLCIEILSNDIRHDRVTKMQKYAKHGVKEYWIVDPVGRYIELYTRSEEGHFYLLADFDEAAPLTSPLFPKLQLNLGQMFPLKS